tara:strand:- start:715 stop:1281 length:567 start_codon:yes stop_codon:yes gene_type:complete
MPVTINGNGSITGLSVGGLGSGVVNTATLANGAASGSKLTMPAGTVIKFQNTKGPASNQNITSTQSWTTFTGTQVDFTPTFSNSKLDLNWVFALEADQNVNGIGFRIYRQSPIGGSDTLIHENYQHSHWGTGSWTGPGQIYLHHVDSPGVTTPVRYFVQGYREQGNSLYINYGADDDGINMTIREVKQ